MSLSHAGRELISGPDDAGRRLDRVLRALLRDRSLSAIYTALRKGKIRVNGAKADPEQKLELGDRIFLHESIDGGSSSPLVAATDELEQIADILVLATADLLFVNKPRGELSQGLDGIEGRIRGALARRSAASLSFSPGPIHRLDRNTSGLLVFPRSARGARAFSSLLRERRIVKRYLALVEGGARGPESWQDRIGRDQSSKTSFISGEGSEASADMRPLLFAEGLGLILVELNSGLTHQIRVQAATHGLPLLGDRKYGGSPARGGYILHALSIFFPEPPFPDLPRLVVAPLPGAARDSLVRLFGAEGLRACLEQAVAT